MYSGRHRACSVELLEEDRKYVCMDTYIQGEMGGVNGTDRVDLITCLPSYHHEAGPCRRRRIGGVGRRAQVGR